jgi:hypothetical protein
VSVFYFVLSTSSSYDPRLLTSLVDSNALPVISKLFNGRRKGFGRKQWSRCIVRPVDVFCQYRQRPLGSHFALKMDTVWLSETSAIPPTSTPWYRPESRKYPCISVENGIRFDSVEISMVAICVVCYKVVHFAYIVCKWAFYVSQHKQILFPRTALTNCCL